MKELKEFTVERLEGFIDDSENFGSLSIASRDLKALAKIALAAKQAEPDYYIHGVEVCDSYGPDIELRAFNNALDASKCQDDHGGEIIPAYTTPPLNHTEQDMVVPDGWIKCSERMPEPYAEIVIRTSHGEVIAGEADGAGFLDLHDGTSVKMSGTTHWMTLPAAPKPESE